MLRICLLLVSLVLLGACDSCGRSSAKAHRFAAGADAAAALPWRPWSAAVLDDAKRDGKPVVISLSGQPCTWCDVLDQTTLSNDRVAELLRTKFILVRADADESPELAERYGAELPQIIALDADGNTVWETGYQQPTPFNQGLYKVLRGERPVKLPRAATAAHTQASRLNDQLPYQLDLGLISSFDISLRGYESPKSLSIDYLRFDLLVGTAMNSTDSRGRVAAQLGSIWKALRDPVDGGFLTGSANADWKALRPEKHAVEQARMAALLVAFAQHDAWAKAYENPPAEYLAGAEQAVAYLKKRLIVDDRVAAGEQGTLAYYEAGAAKRSLEKAPEISKVFENETAGRTAAALADAGRLLGRAEWVELAAAIAAKAHAERTPLGLFYRLPLERKAPNRLAEAAAMLEAALALYAATADEKWLREAERTAKALQALRMPAGYFVAATDTVFPPEAPMDLNARTAEGLWRLSAITNDFALREAAIQTLEQFGAVPPGKHLPAFAVSLFLTAGPIARLEAPRAWLGQPAAAPLVRLTGPYAHVRWIDGAEGRVCTPTKCNEATAELTILQAELGAATKPPVIRKQTN